MVTFSLKVTKSLLKIRDKRKMNVHKKNIEN